MVEELHSLHASWSDAACAAEAERVQRFARCVGAATGDHAGDRNSHASDSDDELAAGTTVVATPDTSDMSGSALHRTQSRAVADPLDGDGDSTRVATGPSSEGDTVGPDEEAWVNEQLQLFLAQAAPIVHTRYEPEAMQQLATLMLLSGDESGSWDTAAMEDTLPSLTELPATGFDRVIAMASDPDTDTLPAALGMAVMAHYLRYVVFHPCAQPCESPHRHVWFVGVGVVRCSGMSGNATALLEARECLAQRGVARMVLWHMSRTDVGSALPATLAAVDVGLLLLTGLSTAVRDAFADVLVGQASVGTGLAVVLERQMHALSTKLDRAVGISHGDGAAFGGQWRDRDGADATRPGADSQACVEPGSVSLLGGAVSAEELDLLAAQLRFVQVLARGPR